MEQACPQNYIATFIIGLPEMVKGKVIAQKTLNGHHYI